jgi:hypothetical protein
MISATFSKGAELQIAAWRCVNSSKAMALLSVSKAPSMRDRVARSRRGFARGPSSNVR